DGDDVRRSVVLAGTHLHRAAERDARRGGRLDESRHEGLDLTTRARDLSTDLGRPVVREVADRVCTARDREPGPRAPRVRARAELRTVAVHPPRLDPLERRLAAG